MITLTARADLTLQAARDRLSQPQCGSSALSALAASALVAASALILAAVVVLGPPQSLANAQVARTFNRLISAEAPSFTQRLDSGVFKRLHR